ncbi:hypothetical protein N657DRAFT_682035 [Parathielavia appendiculata]|uniref:Uncharacterized protein n=1 Tax=Parathielavia appendiculata TaxID=2587402 RepID=A0AAN6TWS4_9PEZI|nr:hypothetical protein N657DRAFT_682035 [Parathielavia appendiculata]
MHASRVSSLRPNLRAAFRQRTPWQFTQSTGRRGYETLQERIATGSDRPWQIAALAVTVPGVLYLRSGGVRPGPSRGAPAGEEKVVEQVAAPSRESEAESTPQAKFEAAVEKTRNSDSESASSSDSEGATTPSSASSDSEQGEARQLGEPTDSLAEKPIGLQASQQEEPTEK